MRQTITDIKPVIKIPLEFLLFLGFILTISLSYITVKFQKEQDLKKISSSIDSLFEGKQEVSDYRLENSKGHLDKVKLEGSNSNLSSLKVVGGEKLLATHPGYKVNSTDTADYNAKLQSFLFYYNLEEYYTNTEGGFDIVKLKKEGDGYVKESIFSTNMAFRVSEYKTIPEKDYGWGNKSEAYTIPSGRGTPNQAYATTLDYLIKDIKNYSYKEGYHDKIERFYLLATDFYKIEVAYANKGKPLFTFDEHNIYNTDWIVWYSSGELHFELEEKPKVFKNRWILYASISSLLVLVIYLLLKFKGRFSISMRR